MDCGKTGEIIRRLRIEKGLTQKQLAERLFISDRTVSKWERGAGLPDVSLLVELSEALGVDMHKMLAGEFSENEELGGNMKNTEFYVCPVCGSISLSTGNADIFCCGRSLSAQKAQKADGEDRLRIQEVEGDWYIESSHPMEKDNYISFLAFAAGGRLEFVKQYPEWELHVRIPKRGHGKLIWYSTTKGLFYQVI